MKARSIIEIVGGPKEHVEKAMGVVVEKLKEGKHVKLLKEKVFEARPLEGKRPLFSTFCEVEVEAKKVDDLFGFCFDFLPSSVEVYEPAEFGMKADVINDMFNELLAKLHQYDLALKNIYAQNILLKRQVDKLEKK